MRALFWFWPHKKRPNDAVLLAEQYRQVFSTENGKAVLEDLLLQAGWADVTPPGGPIERNEGKREIANHIINILRIPESEMAKLRLHAANLQAEFNKSQMELTNDRSEY
ncbi:hypothetical protein [Thalassospira aquimaris]|uniref:Bbp19-like phage domain-containing protein n=1 Tax=Thalassospira aquimaris TaxID=3037796 RepID=A0ABT6GI81_9PROT|nr:hypothetical protein [Thalassospira sp. FZY0004]MDG4721593.1 hypothetical protein [Thalassospira sp. FZY0004]